MKVRVTQLLLLLLAVLFVSCGDRPDPDVRTKNPGVPAEIDAINKRISDDPASAEPYIDRARYHMNRDNFADAIFDIASAMKIDSINEGYHHLLVDAYIGALKSEYAVRTMDRTLRLFPESLETRIKAAELFLILRQYDAARDHLRRALEIAPQNTEALYLLGQLLYEQGDLKLAAQSFQTVVELDADNKEAWTMLGNLLDIQGDPMALQCFENAIAIDSTYSPGLHSKAFYLQNHDRVEEAVGIYQAIHRLDPDYGDAYLNAGILFLELGDVSKAEKEFTMLREVAPYNALGPYYLGVVAERKELPEEALGYYNQASALSPGEVRFSEAAQRLREALAVPAQ